MDKELTARRMFELVDSPLYSLVEGRAVPNYKYCRPDAPIYEWNEAVERWVQVEPAAAES